MYVIRRTAHSKLRVVNVDRLRPYAPRDNNRFPVNQVNDNNGETNDSDELIEIIEANDNENQSDLDASNIDREPILTSRVPRAWRRPLWQDAFDIE